QLFIFHVLQKDPKERLSGDAMMGHKYFQEMSVISSGSCAGIDAFRQRLGALGPPRDHGTLDAQHCGRHGRSDCRGARRSLLHARRRPGAFVNVPKDTRAESPATSISSTVSAVKTSAPAAPAARLLSKLRKLVSPLSAAASAHHRGLATPSAESLASPVSPCSSSSSSSSSSSTASSSRSRSSFRSQLSATFENLRTPVTRAIPVSHSSSGTLRRLMKKF
ncbi:hypothetical protein EVG20_g11011, partial [Dentipellis fragilis]